MSRFRCIIFDLDGTLTQTNELIYATFNHVTEKYQNRIYTPAEIHKMFGPPEDIAIERVIGKERIDEAMEDFYRFYEMHHPRMANAYAGIQEILEYLHQQSMLLAIFTGKGKRTAIITLDIIGLKRYFDVIITGHDVENHKPSADGIRKVLSRFDLLPENVLMVGDAVSDVKAAREAGVAAAAVLWDSYAKEKVLAMDADYVFHSVAEFAEWIRSVIPVNTKVTR